VLLLYPSLTLPAATHFPNSHLDLTIAPVHRIKQIDICVRLEPFPFANVCKRKQPFLFPFRLQTFENDLRTVFKRTNGFEWITDLARPAVSFWTFNKVPSLGSSLHGVNKPSIQHVGLA
jgi:hypothetical protein